jgi:hypothetical protein
MKLHFHSWKPIYIYKNTTFFSEELREAQKSSYEFCPECHSVREFFFDSQGGWWSKIEEAKSKIIFNKIYKENDKYFLRTEKKIKKEVDKIYI